MVAVHQGYANETGSSRSRLQFICTVREMSFRREEHPPGLIVDADALSYRVFDPMGVEVGASTVVDLVADRVRPGTYAPAILVDAGATPGEWTIEWTWDYDIGSEIREYVESTEFTVVDSTMPLVNGYAQVIDARNEDVPMSIPDDRLAVSLARASTLFDHYTGRFFSARYATVDYDVRGNGHMIQTKAPIVAINDLVLTYPDFSTSRTLVSASHLRIYNRHIRGERSDPVVASQDDREAPKVELIHYNDHRGGETGALFDSRMTAAQQNATISGWWGYTDPDGGPFGSTPSEVKRAVLRIALFNARPLWDAYSSGELAAGPIVEDTTRQQTVKYATGAQGGRSALAAGTITGDPLVDMVIRRFRAPPGARSA